MGQRLNSLLAWSCWRTTHDYEVDFLIEDHTAIEVKATQRVSKRDLKGLKALQEEKIFKTFYLVCQDETEKLIDGIHVLHWQQFLT